MGKMFKGCMSVIGIVVVIAIIIGVISMATGGGDSSSSDSSNGGNEESSGSSEESADSGSEDSGSSEEETYGTGEEVEVGAVTYVINGMETSDTVGPSVLEETAQDTFVVLDIEFTNNGDEAVTVDSSYLQLLYDGNTYEADSAASISANQNEDGSIDSPLFQEQVNPGSTVEGQVVFDVTSDVAEADGLQLQMQEGLFGSNTAIVNLDE